MVIDKSKIMQVQYEAMNEVHAEEVDIINQIGELVHKREEGNTPDAQSHIELLLEKLYVHTQEHFSNEEKLMREVGFPPYLMHKSEHDRVLEEATRCYQAWKVTRDSHEMEKFVLEFIPSWIYEHIASMDNVTAMFIQQVKAGSPTVMCCGS